MQEGAHPPPALSPSQWPSATQSVFAPQSFFSKYGPVYGRVISCSDDMEDLHPFDQPHQVPLTSWHICKASLCLPDLKILLTPLLLVFTVLAVYSLPGLHSATSCWDNSPPLALALSYTLTKNCIPIDRSVLCNCLSSILAKSSVQYLASQTTESELLS